MGRRSLRPSSQGIQDIKKALKRKKWSQTYIAGAVGCSRQTIWSLLQGNSTDCDVFMEVCTQLGLNWEDIAEPESPEPQENDTQDIDALVREMRQRIQPYIQERCGTMRVLDMSQPIELGNIYTSVNILEKLTRTRGLDLAALMRDANAEQFDRFCLGDVRERRVPGLQAVEKFSKLMKGRIDELLAEDKKLQQFLRCVEEEARLIEVTYKAAAVRAFYFARNLTLSDDLHPYIDIANTHQARIHILILKKLIEIEGSFVNAIDRNFPPDFDPKLSEILQAFVDDVPIFEDERPGKEDYLWWQVNGQVLVNQFQKVMIESCYIGHGWKFSDAQKESLRQYYNANKLLVDCLNSDCYASREVRQEIEETLLLPIAEIKKRRSRRDDGVIEECNRNDEKT